MQKNAIEERISYTANSKMVVNGDLFDGVLLDINGRKWKSQYVKNVTVRITDGKIALYANKAY